MIRQNNRKLNELRNVKIETGINIHAEGSCMISFGNTKVLCTATVEEKVPHFLKNTKTGWITAEYGMLPRSTETRMDRESKKGKQSGRTQEIQRLIGRSLRSVVDLDKLGERTIKIDCDVIQADGGTRTASITGGFIALYLACQKIKDENVIREIPIKSFVASVSAGIYKGEIILDLNYEEDSNAQTDANFVITEKGELIEVQATAEEKPMKESEFLEILNVAKEGIQELIKLQQKCLLKK